MLHGHGKLGACCNLTDKQGAARFHCAVPLDRSTSRAADGAAPSLPHCFYTFYGQWSGGFVVYGAFPMSCLEVPSITLMQPFQWLCEGSQFSGSEIYCCLNSLRAGSLTNKFDDMPSLDFCSPGKEPLGSQPPNSTTEGQRAGVTV